MSRAPRPSSSADGDPKPVVAPDGSPIIWPTTVRQRAPPADPMKLRRRPGQLDGRRRLAARAPAGRSPSDASTSQRLGRCSHRREHGQRAWTLRRRCVAVPGGGGYGGGTVYQTFLDRRRATPRRCNGELIASHRQRPRPLAPDDRTGESAPRRGGASTSATGGNVYALTPDGTDGVDVDTGGAARGR